MIKENFLNLRYYIDLNETVNFDENFRNFALRLRDWSSAI